MNTDDLFFGASGRALILPSDVTKIGGFENEITVLVRTCRWMINT